MRDSQNVYIFYFLFFIFFVTFLPGNFSRGEKSENDSDDSALLFLPGEICPGEKVLSHHFSTFNFFFLPGNFPPVKYFGKFGCHGNRCYIPLSLLKKSTVWNCNIDPRPDQSSTSLRSQHTKSIDVTVYCKMLQNRSPILVQRSVSNKWNCNT